MAAQHSRYGDYSTRYKFNGKEQDEATGFYYYGARYYAPSLSRWLSTDPLAEKYQGFSPYNYTLNNPVRFVDPDGRFVSRTRAWWYKIWHRGTVGKDKGGEYFVAQLSCRIDNDKIGMTFTYSEIYQDKKNPETEEELIKVWNAIGSGGDMKGNGQTIGHASPISVTGFDSLMDVLWTILQRRDKEKKAKEKDKPTPTLIPMKIVRREHPKIITDTFPNSDILRRRFENKETLVNPLDESKIFTMNLHRNTMMWDSVHKWEKENWELYMKQK